MTKSAAALDPEFCAPFVLADLDALPPIKVQAAFQCIRALLHGVRFDAWTTWNHGHAKQGEPNAHTRVRVLVPLTRAPRNLEERACVWATVNAAQGGLLAHFDPDQACADATRGQAIPSNRIGAHVTFHRQPGAALDTNWAAAFARDQALKVPATQIYATDPCLRPADVPLHKLTHADLIQYATAPTTSYKAEALAVLEGRSWAPRGKRYEALRGLLAGLWSQLRSRGRWLDSGSLWPVFERSVAAVNGEGVDQQVTETTLRDLVEAWAAKKESENQRARAAALEFLDGLRPASAER
jgi:hypothetical protein